MYLVELDFECFDNTTINAVEKAINALVEALRFNGQILGREFPVIMGEASFRLRAICPEQDSLHPKNHSNYVKKRWQELSDACVLAPKIRLLGQDMNSEYTAPMTETPPSWQILYTTYVHNCSPLRDGDNFMPIPLYRNPPTLNGDHKSLIKWQTEWQACDELQMAGGCKAEHAALREITDISSDLFRRGWDLRGRLEYVTKVPTYYYLYRVGGESLAAEKARQCPRCGGDWLLDEPAHEMFHFKCDDCPLGVEHLMGSFKISH